MENGYLGQSINIARVCAERLKSRDDGTGELPIRVVLCARGVISILTIKWNQGDIDGWIAHAIKGVKRAASRNPTVILNLLRGALRQKINTYDAAVSSEHENREAQGDR